MLNSLLRFSCFTILLTCLLAAIYSATVSLLLILFFHRLSASFQKPVLTSLLIHYGLLMVARLFSMCLLLEPLNLLLRISYPNSALFLIIGCSKVIKFSPHCIKICSSKVVVVFFLMIYFPFLFLLKM